MDFAAPSAENGAVTLQKAVRNYAKDAALLVEGQSAGNEILYLVRGTAIAEVGGNVVGTINPGEWFGELAPILGSYRTATVRAVTPCEVMSFTGLQDTNLMEAISKDPKMVRKLLEQLSMRLIETSRLHSGETADLARQALRYRRAISGTLHVLEKLTEHYKSKVMQEVREHLSALSGIPTGQAADADPKFFIASQSVIFGGRS